MSKQAKTFTADDLHRVLDHIASRKHAARNRAMVLFSHLAGVRISELVAIRYNDVVDEQGRIRDEFRLRANETKGKHGGCKLICVSSGGLLTSYLRNRHVRHTNGSYQTSSIGQRTG